MANKNDWVKSRSVIVIFLALICLGAIVVFSHLNQDLVVEDTADWNLTLVGNGKEMVLSLEDLKAMPATEGYGGFFTTVGVLNGPYKCRGVPVVDLCQLVSELNSSNLIRISALDGYMMSFSTDQVWGDFHTFDPDSFREVPHKGLTMILMYEQDGDLLSDYNGKPFRIAIVSSDNEFVVTEGHNWVKWVEKIEVRVPVLST